MATSLATTLKLVLSHVYTNALDLSTPDDSMRLDKSDSMANGTSTDQCNALWHDTRTLAATSETLNLTALASDPVVGGNVTLTGVKCVLIHNKAATTAFDLHVGGAAATQWSGMVADQVSDEIVIPPNGLLLWWSPLDTDLVDATHKSLKIDSGANSVTYDIVIYGTKA